MSALYEILQSKKSSSSGTGNSFYSVAANCGMKAQLQILNPYEEQETDGTDYTATGKRKVNGRRCGTFYHSLQEMWRLEQIPENLVISADHSDYDYELALHSFCQYRKQFRNDRHNLGRVVSAEVTLPENDEQRNRVLEFTGGIPFTMRYDLLTDVGIEDMGRIAVERELALPRTGLYLDDYKLLASIGATTISQYSYEFQQLAYPIIYNICRPEQPVVGMLTEVMARVQKPEPRHFALYLAYADANAKEIVRDGIRMAHKRLQEGQANPFACIGKYGPCWWLSNGICPRHGKFSEFDFTDGMGRRRVAA